MYLNMLIYGHKNKSRLCPFNCFIIPLKREIGGAMEQFEIKTNNTFLPHLSLLYSHLEIANKKLLMESIAIGSPLSVTINEAVLVETNGGPDQWQEVTRIPFS